MKRTMLKIVSLAGIMAALALALNAQAGEIGHFNGGVMNIRDYVMPDPGLYTAIYNYFYTNTLDQVHAVGDQLGLTYIPWVLSVNLHGFYEYLAENRFQGGSFGMSVAKKF
jgi:hypothetical protein